MQSEVGVLTPPLRHYPAGAAVSTVKKHDAGSNKARAGNPNAVKLDAETEDFHHEQVSSELKKQIQQARLAKKLSQAQVGGTELAG